MTLFSSVLDEALPQLTPPKLPSSIFKCDIGA